MQMICDGSHAIGELLGVWDDRVIVAGITADRPAVIENYVVVA
jgi:hypothetical protein